MKLLGPSLEEAVNVEVDIFGRDSFADRLLNLFSECDDPLVIALDEKWGTGKTVFARRLAKKASEKNITAVYFDAFKRDYDPDVFVSIAAELLAILPKDEKANSLRTKAKSVGKILARVAIKSAVRAATFGAANAADFGEMASDVENDIGDVAEAELDKIIDERLKGAETEDQTFESFRKALETLYLSSNSEETGKPNRVLIIVDELDRCRPDHALNILETIKHFFSVPNVHFLLICDRDQIAASIKNIYGADLNAILYLEKFIHILIKFPRHEEDELNTIVTSLLMKYCDYLNIYNHKMRSAVQSLLKFADQADGVLLRKIQRVMILVSISSKNLDKSKSDYYDFVYYITVFLCYMKHIDIIDYQKFKNQSLRFSEIQSKYKLQLGNNDWILEFIHYLTIPKSDIRDEKFAEYKKLINNPVRFLQMITTGTIDLVDV